MSTVNIFERAARAKLRFVSIKGELVIEQLWDLPLQSTTGFDLDSIAKNTNAQLKALTADSFIPSARPNPAKAELELKLEILVHIIGVRVDENQKKLLKAHNDARRTKLYDALEKKQDAELLGMSAEDIRKELDKLEG